MGACNQITILILYYISSRLATLVKVIDAPIQVPNILILLLDSSSSILAFKYSFFLLPKCPPASRLTLFRLPTLLWFGSRNHCILPYFLWSKNREHSSSIHGSATSIHTDVVSYKNYLLNHHFSPHLVHANSKQWQYISDLSELYITHYHQ